jgi:hypothetical protein
LDSSNAVPYLVYGYQWIVTKEMDLASSSIIIIAYPANQCFCFRESPELESCNPVIDKWRDIDVAGVCTVFAQKNSLQYE